MDGDDVSEELDARYLEELVQRIRTSPFHQWAGMELLTVGGGNAEVAMVLQPQHFNPQGIVHGGIIAAMADTSIGLALRSMLKPGFTHRTAQLNVHFVSKGEGNRIVGRGRSIHLGRRMGYGEAEVVDAAGGLLAKASATFIVLPAPGAF
ncbi:MAG: PaaI family thioesterase [Actinomycetota bacterium]